jgi:ribonuclease E
MTPVRNQRQVEESVRDALKLDRARIQVGRISRFGLLEMSRQRLRSSFEEANQVTCPRCFGRGSIRSVESFAMSVIRLVEEQAISEEIVRIEIQVPIDVATFILNEQRHAITGIEDRQAVSIIIIPNTHLQSPNYRIKALKIDETGSAGAPARFAKSYNIGDDVESEPAGRTHGKEHRAVEEQQKPILEAITPPPAPKKSTGGLIKKLWTSMFGDDRTAPEESKIKSGTGTNDRYASPRTRGASASITSPVSSNIRNGNTMRPYRPKRPVSPSSTLGGGDNRNRTRRGTRGSGNNRPPRNNNLGVSTPPPAIPSVPALSEAPPPRHNDEDAAPN